MRPDMATAATVMTVRGSIPAAELGVTMAHEHALVINPSFVEPREASTIARAQEPISLRNLGWIRQHWTSHRDNLRLVDEALAVEELRRFARAGGDAIVDPTVDGIGRDPLALYRISRELDIHIVMGAGYYIEDAHPPGIAKLDVDGLTAGLVSELREGVGDTGITPGFLGEIGCSWPLRDRERQVLEASGLAAREAGVSVMVHPGRHPDAPGEIIDVLSRAGLPLERVILAHMERTDRNVTRLRELLQRGMFLSVDVFGLETSMMPEFGGPAGQRAWPRGLDVPSDAQRLELLEALVAEGHVRQLLISQDVCTKHRLAAYGGHGYDHILANVVPWMRRRGWTDDDLDAVLVANPARAFSLHSPA